MAFTYGFYNYDGNDSSTDAKLYDAEQMSQFFDGLITEGIYEHVGEKFHVSAPNDSSENLVYIGTGRAWLCHTWNNNDSSYAMEAPVPPTFNPRIDVLVIDVNSETRHNEFAWVIGTETAPGQTDTSPIPSLINTETHKQLPIAHVLRNVNTSVITNSDIMNLAGSSESPYVSGVLKNDIIFSNVLVTGQTSVTFSNVTVGEAIVSVGTSKPGVEYEDISVNGTTYTVTFNAQNEDITVYLIVSGVR